MRIGPHGPGACIPKAGAREMTALHEQREK